jgi:selenocysteine lyase/cysteine desulfurase
MRRSRRDVLKGAGAAAVLAQLGLIGRRSMASAQVAGAQAAGGSMAARYSLAPDVTYLNHASIGTVPLAVQRAHRDYLDLCETNPWLYMWSEPWAEPREAVRARAANLLGCASEELAITHNTTEFFNVLAQGLPLGPGDEVLFSSLNHAGASVCWFHQAPVRGFSARRFDFPVADVMSLDEDTVVARYAEAIGPQTRALVLPHVDNQVGLRHPVARIAAAARERGVRWVAVDGAQTAAMLPLDVREMGVDVFATSAHKWIQSPKGLGLAYVREALLSELRPMWVTWGQEYWRGDARVFEDYGTRAMPAVLALGDALAFQRAIEDEHRAAHYRELRRALRELVDRRDDLAWRSPYDWNLGASLVAIEVRGGSSKDVAANLFREHGIVVRPFSLPGYDALRVSPNLANDAADLERLIESV